jgi:plastocyanin
VTIEAATSHPFMSICAEDDVFDAVDGQTTEVSVTFATPGYYNYRCQFHPMMVGNIQVVTP